MCSSIQGRRKKGGRKNIKKIEEMKQAKCGEQKKVKEEKNGNRKDIKKEREIDRERE